MRRGGRRRASTPPTLTDLRRFAVGGVAVTYDGRSWSPIVLDVDLDQLHDEHDRREAQQ